MNPYMYNPAYAGVEGHTVVFFMYRRQWANIDDSPQVMHGSFHVPLKGGVALGGAAFNITQGLLNTSAAKVSAGYLINIDRTHFLRFGLSIGGGTNGINLNALELGVDPAIDGFVEQNSFLIGDFGLTYHFGHFNIGLSLPNLFSYDVITQEGFSSPEVTPTDNVLFKMNYRGHINDDFAIEPHLIYRYSNIVPSQYEAVLIAHIKHLVWVGASYRQDAGIIGLAGTKVKEKIGIGFSYELGNSSISDILGPTFELKIGYHLGTKKEHAQHVSSFIKSHRLSAEERARKEEVDRQNRLAALQINRTETSEDALSIVGENENSGSNQNSTLREPEVSAVDGTETTTTDAWTKQDKHPEISRTNRFGEEEVGRRLEKESSDGTAEVVISWVPEQDADQLELSSDGHLERQLDDGSKEIGVKYTRTNEDGSKEQVVIWDRAIDEQKALIIQQNEELSEEEHDIIERGDPSLTEDYRSIEELVSSNEPLRVKRGTHLLELPSGNFVIAGAFTSFDHAETFSDELFQSGFHDVIVGFSSARGYYYVVIYQSNDIAQARARRDEIRRIPNLSNVWVLQVEE